MDSLILTTVPSSPTHIYKSQLIGGKAHHLQLVSTLNLNVPHSWVIPTNEYIAHLYQPSIQEVLQQLQNGESGRSKWLLIQEAILTTPMQSGLLKALTVFHDNHSSSASRKLLSVRSSANVEDGRYHSFAGIFTSSHELGSIEEVVNSVKRCWSSVWSQRATDYSRHIGLALRHIQMAVLIQETITVHAAGVAFTCDPRSMNSEYFIIEAISQRGEALVSGHVSPEYYNLSSETGNLLAYNLNPTGEAVLSNTDLAWLWLAVKTIREHFDDEQEIEWIINPSGKGYIVQTRSITTSLKR